MKNRKGKFAIYGLIGILILVVTYFGFGFLKGSQLFKKSNIYYVYYDRIDGLNTSSVVVVNGYKIGKVAKIELHPERNCSLLVSLEIGKEFQIPDSSVAEIAGMDIMGTKGIEMHFGNKSTYHKSGDFLIGSVQESLKEQVSSEVLPVKKAVEDLMAEVTDVINIVSGVFNEGTRDNLEHSFLALRRSLDHLESSIGHLDGILEEETSDIVSILSNAKKITDSISSNSEEINNFIENLSTFSDTLIALDLSRTINNANRAIAKVDTIVTKINNGKGTIGELLNDNTLALQIENASMNLDKLLTDIRLNPRKYINLSLVSGRTYYVTDEGTLSNSDLEKLKRQREKDLEIAEKNLKKEMKADKKNGLFFMIQIKSSATRINLSSEEFKGCTDITEIKTDDGYKYFLYPHTNPKYTNTYLHNAAELFNGVFAVAMYNGTIISYSEGKNEYLKTIE